MKIAIMGTRLGCIEGESIEAENWFQLLKHLGYEVHMIAGLFGEIPSCPYKICPLLDHKHPEIRAIKQIMFERVLDKNGKKTAKTLLSNIISRLRPDIKKHLVHEKYDLLVVMNIFSEPINLAATLVLRDVAKDLNLPVLSIDRTFIWDSQTYTKVKNFPELLDNIPPKEKNIIHIVHTKKRVDEVAAHTKITPKIIPKFITPATLDLENARKKFRAFFEIPDDVYLFLQPTRVSSKKGVEHSIKIISEINKATKRENILVITGPAKVYRGSYFEDLVRKMQKLKVEVIFAHEQIGLKRGTHPFTMRDAYAASDLVLFPSSQTGFGRPVLESMAYEKPLAVYKQPYYEDIKEQGAQFIEFEKVDEVLISDIMEMLMNEEKRTALQTNNKHIIDQWYTREKNSELIIELLNTIQKQPFFARMKKRLIG